MTASVITTLAPVNEDKTWTETPYKLEIKGKAEPRVTVKEILEPSTGAKLVRIIALTAAGAPVQPLSTLDQIARNILPGARIKSKLIGSRAMVREYAVQN